MPIMTWGDADGSTDINLRVKPGIILLVRQLVLAELIERTLLIVHRSIRIRLLGLSQDGFLYQCEQS